MKEAHLTPSDFVHAHDLRTFPKIATAARQTQIVFLACTLLNARNNVLDALRAGE
jgi:hypothetical protein